LYLCDVDQQVGERRMRQAEKRQKCRPKFVRDFRRVLDDPHVDLVAIATPNHWHALLAVWAMQAGKDVYLEKPVSHTVSEGRVVAETARRHGRICQAGLQCRSNPGMIAAIRFLHSGALGDVRLARGLCYQRRKPIGPSGMYTVPSDLDYDLWLGPAPRVPLTRPQLHHDWHWQWAYGGGDLANQGVHQMDIARWGLGATTLSQGVFSFGGRFANRDAGETPNTQVVLHDFGTKSIVFEVRNLNSSSFQSTKVGVVFECSRGRLVMTSYHSGTAFDREGNPVRSFHGQGDHVDNFIRAVRTRDPRMLTADIYEGHLSSALCHLGNISYRLGEPVRAEAVAERLEARLGKHITTPPETSPSPALSGRPSLREGVARMSPGHRCALTNQASTVIASGDHLLETFHRMCDHLRANRVDLHQQSFQVGPHLRFDPVAERFIDSRDANQLLTREYRPPYVLATA
jgi:predicted dehydrogenase